MGGSGRGCGRGPRGRRPRRFGTGSGTRRPGRSGVRCPDHRLGEGGVRGTRATCIPGLGHSGDGGSWRGGGRPADRRHSRATRPVARTENRCGGWTLTCRGPPGWVERGPCGLQPSGGHGRSVPGLRGDPGRDRTLRLSSLAFQPPANSRTSFHTSSSTSTGSIGTRSAPGRRAPGCPTMLSPSATILSWNPAPLYEVGSTTT